MYVMSFNSSVVYISKYFLQILFSCCHVHSIIKNITSLLTMFNSQVSCCQHAVKWNGLMIHSLLTSYLRLSFSWVVCHLLGVVTEEPGVPVSTVYCTIVFVSSHELPVTTESWQVACINGAQVHVGLRLASKLINLPYWFDCSFSGRFWLGFLS